MRQHTLLVVGNLVVEEKTLGTELYGSNSLATDVEEVALLKVSELSVGLRTLKLRDEFTILLGRGQAGDCESKKGEVCSAQHPSLD